MIPVRSRLRTRPRCCRNGRPSRRFKRAEGFHPEKHNRSSRENGATLSFRCSTSKGLECPRPRGDFMSIVMRQHDGKDRRRSGKKLLFRHR